MLAAVSEVLAAAASVSEGLAYGEPSSLSTDLRPMGATKLREVDSVWRVRRGDHRIIYQIDDGVLTILVIKVGHRHEVYRELG